MISRVRSFSITVLSFNVITGYFRLMSKVPYGLTFGGGSYTGLMNMIVMLI